MSILSFLGGALGAGVSAYNNWQNIKFQEQTNVRNEALMRESWAREDTALQRRVADATAAGINPYAISGGSPAGSPIRLEAPQIRENPAISSLAAMSTIADIKNKEQVTRNLDLDARLKEATLDSKIQEAEASAKLATETLAARIQKTTSEATIISEEARTAWSYYTDRANKILNEEQITYLDKLMKQIEYEAASKYRLTEEQQKLLKLQQETIYAAAAAGLKELDLKTWQAIGVDPAAGRTILTGAALLLRALTSK